MANDYTNTGEHYLPVPAITDQFSYSRDINTLRIQINKGLAGLAAYDSNGSNYVLAAANAGAILSSVGAAPRGRVIGAASGQDPTLSFQLNTGAALSTAWTFGVDDSDSDKFKIESDATIGTAPEFTLDASGNARFLGDLIVQGGDIGVDADTDLLGLAANALTIRGSAQATLADAMAITALSGASGSFTGIGIGRTVSEVSISICAAAGQYFPGAAAGDFVINKASGAICLDATDSVIAPAIYVSASNAGVGINSVDKPTANGTGCLFFGDSQEPTLAANTCAFYGDDVAGTVEAFAVDEAGNQVQLTQHNETTGEVIHWSANSYSGRKLLIWMERAFRALERITGEQYVVETWRPVEQCRDWNAVQAQQAAARDAEIAAWDVLDAMSKRDRSAPEPFRAKAVPAYIATAMKAQGRAV